MAGEKDPYLDNLKQLWEDAAKVEYLGARLSLVLGSLGGVAGTGSGVLVAYEIDKPVGAIIAGASLFGAKKVFNVGQQMRRSANLHKALSQAETYDDIELINSSYERQK